MTVRDPDRGQEGRNGGTGMGVGIWVEREIDAVTCRRGIETVSTRRIRGLCEENSENGVSDTTYQRTAVSCNQCRDTHKRKEYSLLKVRVKIRVRVRAKDLDYFIH